jgi:hypothetical protein
MLHLVFLATKAEFCPDRKQLWISSSRGKLVLKLLENPELTMYAPSYRKLHAAWCDPENNPKHIHYVGALFFDRERLRFIIIKPDDPRLHTSEPELLKEVRAALGVT